MAQTQPLRRTGRFGIVKNTAIPARMRAIVVARAMGRCERCGSPLIKGEWHHRRSRRVKDKHTHHPCNGVWLCRTCHQWTHANPLLARQSGFLISSHEDEPGTVAVDSHFGALQMECDGSFEYVVGDEIQPEPQGSVTELIQPSEPARSRHYGDDAS